MQLGLTFPLQRKLKLKYVPYGDPIARLFAWDLHCISLRGQDSLLMVHCASRYTVVACGLSPFDWDNIADFAAEQIRLGLLDAGLPKVTVARYLQNAGSMELTRTHGRREVAFLNRAWEDVLSLDFTVDPSTLRQPLLEQAVNARPCRCAEFDGKDSAANFLKRSLSAEFKFT